MVQRARRLTLEDAGAQTVQQYVDAIKKGGGSAELFMYPGEGHAFMVRPAGPHVRTIGQHASLALRGCAQKTRACA